MRVLLTLDFPPALGGIQRYLHSIVESQYGPDDWVLVPGRGGEALDKELAPRVERFGNVLGKVNRKLAVLECLGRIARFASHGATIECGNIYAALAPFFVSRFQTCPYEVYVYGSELLGMRRCHPVAPLLGAALRGARKVWAVSRYAGELAARLGVEAPIEVRPPTIPRAVSAPNRRTTTAVPRILSVGRLVLHKGHHVLLEAAARLKEKNWELVIVGDGPRRDALTGQAARLGLSQRVRILTSLSDRQLDDEYSRAAVFVLPSLERRSGVEGFGIVLLEAMARQTPIVASRSGGIPEPLNNGDCGLLVEPGDAAALAEAIARLLDNRELAAELARRGLERLERCYVRD